MVASCKLSHVSEQLLTKWSFLILSTLWDLTDSTTTYLPATAQCSKIIYEVEIKNHLRSWIKIQIVIIPILLQDFLLNMEVLDQIKMIDWKDLLKKVNTIYWIKIRIQKCFDPIVPTGVAWLLQNNARSTELGKNCH